MTTILTMMMPASFHICYERSVLAQRAFISLRVLCRTDIDEERDIREVVILAIGTKQGNRLRIAGKEY